MSVKRDMAGSGGICASPLEARTGSGKIFSTMYCTSRGEFGKGCDCSCLLMFVIQLSERGIPMHSAMLSLSVDSSLASYVLQMN